MSEQLPPGRGNHRECGVAVNVTNSSGRVIGPARGVGPSQAIREKHDRQVRLAGHHSETNRTFSCHTP